MIRPDSGLVNKLHAHGVISYPVYNFATSLKFVFVHDHPLLAVFGALLARTPAEGRICLDVKSVCVTARHLKPPSNKDISDICSSRAWQLACCHGQFQYFMYP